MKRLLCGLLLTAGIIGSAEFQTSMGAEENPATPIFDASDSPAIAAKEGQKITVRGVVSSVRKSRGGTNFINFADSEFYLVTFKSDLQAFDKGEPADLFRGKHLAVTGVVSIYQGKPQMKLNHPGMVEVVDPDAPEENPAKPSPSSKDGEEKETVKKTEPKSKPNAKKKRPPVDPKKYFK